MQSRMFSTEHFQVFFFAGSIDKISEKVFFMAE